MIFREKTTEIILALRPRKFLRRHFCP